MDVRPNLTIPLLEQSKIQAQVLVPVLRAFRAELGEERANRIAWRALAEWRQSVARATAAGLQGSPREGEVQFTRTGTIMRGADRCDFRYRLGRSRTA